MNLVLYSTVCTVLLHPSYRTGHVSPGLMLGGADMGRRPEWEAHEMLRALRDYETRERLGEQGMARILSIVRCRLEDEGGGTFGSSNPPPT